MDDDIDNDCDGATSDNNDDGGDNDSDDNNAMDNNVDNNGDGATDDNVDDDNGNLTLNSDCTAEDNVDDNGYGRTKDDINDNYNGATDGCHCLDACGSCVTKGDTRRRHVTTSNVTTSWQTRCNWEERRQRTRGNRALMGQGCALRGGGRV